jgi:hypothetical protein
VSVYEQNLAAAKRASRRLDEHGPRLERFTKSRPPTAGRLRLIRTSTLPLESVEALQTVQKPEKELINRLSTPTPQQAA